MPASIVSDDTFQSDVLNNSTNFVLVDFWAEWCGPCKLMSPVVDAISDKYQGQLAVYKMDTDSNPKTAQEAQIVSIPCLILYKNGQEVTRFTGFKPQDAFEADLKQYLS